MKFIDDGGSDEDENCDVRKVVMMRIMMPMAMTMMMMTMKVILPLHGLWAMEAFA